MQLISGISVVFLLALWCRSSALRTVQPSEATDWWQKTVFYQIYPRSFKDSNGDGVGDLRGIIEMLPHLADLGVGATWLSPIMKSPMVDFGYDVSDFLEIDEIFGTMDDFDELMVTANELDIKIIMDFVPNHTSDQHDWFLKSENKEPGFENFYIWHPGKMVDGQRQPPNNWVAVFRGKAWEWSDVRQEYYYHQFAVQQPDLNYRNPAVMEAMKEVFRFWMAKGVAGFRIDAINHLMEYEHLKDEPRNPDVDDEDSYSYVFHDYTLDLPETYEFVYEFRKVMDDWTTTYQTETKILMSEAYTSVPNVMRYYVSDDRRKIGSHFAFNFMLINDVGPDTNAEGFKTIVLDRWFDALPEGRTSNWVLGNHDRPRIASRYGSDRVSALLTLEMTLPGVAITYYGEEIGMLDHRDISWNDTVDPQACNSNPDDYRPLSRDPQRTPMQWDFSSNAGFSSTTEKTWLPLHPDYMSNNLADQKLRGGRTYSLYKQLVALRSSPTFWNGDFTYTTLNENVLAYTRSLKGNDTYTVVINFGDQAEQIDLCPLIPKCTARAARASIEEILAKFYQFEVVVSGIGSKYLEGDLIMNGFTIDAYDALILKSGAAMLSTSMCLMLFAILFIFIWHV